MNEHGDVFFCCMPLAQTWHARAEFYRSHSRFIIRPLKCSSYVAPGQAFNRGPADALRIEIFAQLNNLCNPRKEGGLF
jgi:hypothetical protein